MSAIEYDIADDADYLHVCAQLKAREFEFIEKSKLERMLYSLNVDDFLKNLSETYYSKFTNLITPEKNFDEIFINNNRETIDYLSNRLKTKHLCIMDLLMFEENIHNYKVLLKAFLLKENLNNIFLPSLYTYQVLMDEISGQGYACIDENTTGMLKIIQSLKDNIQPDLKIDEISIEKAYMERLYSRIENTGNEMIKDFLKHLIDITNIKNVIRVKYANSRLDYDIFLHEKGDLSVEYLKKFAPESIDAFVQELASGQYGTIATKGLNALENYSTFFSFEKYEYIYYLNFFEPVRYTVANLEKVFSFFMRKKIELKILNIIYLGILYGMEKSKIESKVELMIEN
ncbi:MAG: V-type ATPase subunit [Actinobacteria bacterium]|nr:V-type ATPase subunit [Actinomycetota bacterium]